MAKQKAWSCQARKKDNIKYGRVKIDDYEYAEIPYPEPLTPEELAEYFAENPPEPLPKGKRRWRDDQYDEIQVSDERIIRFLNNFRFDNGCFKKDEDK
ncbi:MAG: hypothetical protein FJ123_01000 [Deltaproteobacteria bacterium]|nr:hypothetical protein [Deltaproteobacteria bacterium]